MQAIFYKLKTGCQWRCLPLKAFLWVNDGSLQQAWTQLLKANRHRLDGSYTLAKNGGQAVGYQKRKRTKTTNMLFVT